MVPKLPPPPPPPRTFLPLEKPPFIVLDCLRAAGWSPGMPMRLLVHGLSAVIHTKPAPAFSPLPRPGGRPMPSCTHTYVYTYVQVG